MRKYVVATLMVLGLLGGGAALAAPATDSPACSGDAGKAATHNKHCPASGGEPGGKARGDDDGGVGFGTPLQDSDGDGHADDADNCPATRNRHQHDHDGDGVGDVCETDDTDGDRVPDGFESCRTPDELEEVDRVGDPCAGADDDDGDLVPEVLDNRPSDHQSPGERVDESLATAGAVVAEVRTAAGL